MPLPLDSGPPSRAATTRIRDRGEAEAVTRCRPENSTRSCEYAEIQLQRLDVAVESRATNLTGVAVDFHIVSREVPHERIRSRRPVEEFSALSTASQCCCR
jgi:hypothetical protein